MNWIASIFVRNPTGDAAAATLRAQPGKVTLYLALNRGYPEKADEDNAVEFLRVLRKVLRLFQHDRSSAHMQLVYMAVSASNARLSHKLEAIDKMPRIYTPDGAKKPIIIPVDAHFANLVVKWNAAGHNEGDVLLDFARRYDKNAVLMDGNAALHFVFANFIALIRKNKVGEEDEMYVFRDVEDKTRRGASLCGLAHVLVSSTFFKALPSRFEPTPFSMEENLWLHKLRRRLWRVAYYTSDASILVRTGLKFFATVLGAEGLKSFFEGDGGFCIEWVGRQPGIVPDGHGRSYYRPKSLINRFDGLLAEEVDSIKIGVDDREKLLKDLDFGGPLEQVWKTENAVIPHLHCELQLIHYLERNDIAVHKNVIGVTKLTCFACHAYLGAVNTRRKLAGLGPWMLPGASNKFHPAWLIPQSTEGIQAVNLIWERLKKGIQDLARRELRRKRVNGYGSNRNEHRPNNDIARYLSAIAITDTTTYK
ncbi:hypothetical protein BU15DRAFT_81837 [Melanogaster broomeanus]|nr:hypothetical protein BU15DRAFT_81837 [Melanogaster broomeanus]